MEHDMICNVKKCRKTIAKWAWVTSCSHIFCDSCGHKEFTVPFACPACQTKLPGNFDILRVDLLRCEQYKSMILAGHKPDTILEVCSRAIAFWTYQIHQELSYQKYVLTNTKERSHQIEQFYEQMISRTQAEMNNLKTQISSSKKDLEDTRRKYSEVSEKMTEKARQYSKLQTLYNNMRLRFLNPNQDNRSSSDFISRLSRAPTSAFNLGVPTTAEDVFGRVPDTERRESLATSLIQHNERGDFVFRPTTTPTISTALVGGTPTLHSRFTMLIGTPRDQPERPLETNRNN